MLRVVLSKKQDPTHNTSPEISFAKNNQDLASIKNTPYFIGSLRLKNWDL